MSKENLKLWEKVCKTIDPGKNLKPVKYGKRSFTAINAQHQMHVATREWGPYGGQWGVKNIDFMGFPHEEPKWIVLRGTFFYPGGEFEVWVDSKVSDDVTKKLLTDLTTKALSKLGFNADVFFGEYDEKDAYSDNKYLTSGSQSVPKTDVSASLDKIGV